VFDITEAKKAVNRVRERSIGPDTVHDLSGLLSKATSRVEALQADLHNTQVQIATEAEQRKNQLADADHLVLQAIRDRDTAIELERNHSLIVQLATELDRLVHEVEAGCAQLASLKDAHQIAQDQATTTIAVAAHTAQQIAAERDAALTRDAAHRDTLAQIADLAWWNRIRSATLAREAIADGDRR
jgi:hypothetical protein